MSPAESDHEILDHQRRTPGRDGDALRQPADRLRRRKREPRLGLRGRIAPEVLGDDGQPERLARDRKRRPDRFPAMRRAGHEVDRRLLRQLAELISREGIDADLERELLLAVGLQAIAGRALAAVAEPHGQGIAAAQVAAADADQDRVRPRPDVEPVEPHFELGAVARFDRGVVRRRGIGELRLAHVGGRAPRNLDDAGVVDAEGPGSVGQGQLLVGACDEWSGRIERRGAHVRGQVGGEWHRAGPTVGCWREAN